MGYIYGIIVIYIRFAIKNIVIRDGESNEKRNESI